MKRLIEFSIEDDDFILVEVEEQQRSGTTRVSRSSEVPEKAQKSFEQALHKIKPVARGIIKELRSLQEPVNEVEVKFGVKMSAEAGAVIASASVEANYEVTLKWKQ